MKKEDMEFLKDSNIVLVAIAKIGPAEKMAEHIRKKCNNFALITLASTYSKGVVPCCRFYHKNILKKEFRLASFVVSFSAIDPLFFLPIIYAMHFFSVYYAFYRLRKRFDVYLGIGYVFTLFGLLFRRLGICRKVIYYSGDYFREAEKWRWNQNWYRFFQTRCFQWIDRINIRLSDAVWNINSAMVMVRKEKGISYPKDRPNLIVPLGITVEKELLKHKRYELNEIVFIGNLQKNQGLTLFLNILPELIKDIPDIKLHIVGTGSYEATLKNLVNSKQLNDYVEFYGFVKSQQTLNEIFSRCVLGLAHYIFHKESFTQYTTPAKVMTYLSYGLPVIITDISEIAEKICQAKAGIIINYSKTELKKAVLKLLKTKELLNLYGQNAKNLALTYSWDKILNKALAETFNAW